MKYRYDNNVSLGLLLAKARNLTAISIFVSQHCVFRNVIIIVITLFTHLQLIFHANYKRLWLSVHVFYKLISPRGCVFFRFTHLLITVGLS